MRFGHKGASQKRYTIGRLALYFACKLEFRRVTEEMYERYVPDRPLKLPVMAIRLFTCPFLDPIAKDAGGRRRVKPPSSSAEGRY